MRASIAAPAAALGVVIVLSVLAPLIAPYDPLAQAGPELAPPSAQHWLGTDLIGRDVFSRVLYGGLRTLMIALLALICTVLPGLIIGVVAGSSGGLFDQAVSALLDALLAIPSLLIALSVVALAGSGPEKVALAVGVAGFPAYARVARSAAKAVCAQPYMDAARMLGARRLYTLGCYVLPNAAPPLVAFATVTLAWAILNAATLNFLGFSGDPAIPEWGAMLADARQVFRAAPWVAVGPGTAITITLLIVNLLADGLQRR